MKKCPYCYTELDARASICSSCRKKVGEKGRNGIAKKYTSPVTKLILFMFIVGMIPVILLPFYEQDKQERSKADADFQKESTIKKVVPEQTRTFTLAEKKKICDHTTIADDISGLIGRGLEEGRALVAKHFNITQEQFKQINVEGLEKVWSMPPETARNNPEYEYLWRTKDGVKPGKKYKTLSASDFAGANSKITARDGTLIAYASGVVYDKNAGLEWLAGPDRNTTWNGAKAWVESLNVAGGGWRMPTGEELKTLYQRGAGTRHMTPLLKTTGWWVWSWGTKDLPSARAFGFYYGGELWHAGTSASTRGFAVRSRRQ